VHVYFKSDNSVTWQGNYYTGTAVQISERSRDSDGKLSRPTLTIANPLAVYSPMVSQGYLDNATITERKVLYAHLLANSNIYTQRTWKVRRPTSCTHLQISLELRDSLDSQKFLLPARTYNPDDGFPSVSL
jgi:phage-related protein